MNYDKVSYLFWSILVLFVILGTSIFAKYGSNLINDKTFRMFFGWYITLVILNLFNILLNLIYHYFMKNLQGPRGLKGEPGDRGLPGKDDKCGCSNSIAPGYEGDGFSIDDADRISTRTIGFEVDDSIGVDFEIDKAPEDLQGKFGTVMVGDRVHSRAPPAIEEQAGAETGVAAAPSPVSAPLTVDPSITKESLIERIDRSLQNLAIPTATTPNIMIDKNLAQVVGSEYEKGLLELSENLNNLKTKISESSGSNNLLLKKVEVDLAIILPFYIQNETSLKDSPDNNLRANKYSLKESLMGETIDISLMFQISDLKKSLDSDNLLAKPNTQRINFFHIRWSIFEYVKIPIGNYYGGIENIKTINFPAERIDESIPDPKCETFYQVFYDLEKRLLINLDSVPQEVKDAAQIEIETLPEYQCS